MMRFFVYPTACRANKDYSIWLIFKINLVGNKVPPSLLEKAGKLREEGGADVINKLMSDLPELLNRNREILDVVSSWRKRVNLKYCCQIKNGYN